MKQKLKDVNKTVQCKQFCFQVLEWRVKNLQFTMSRFVEKNMFIAYD